jgi:hypothetical protein
MIFGCLGKRMGNELFGLRQAPGSTVSQPSTQELGGLEHNTHRSNPAPEQKPQQWEDDDVEQGPKPVKKHQSAYGGTYDNNDVYEEPPATSRKTRSAYE